MGNIMVFVAKFHLNSKVTYQGNQYNVLSRHWTVSRVEGALLGHYRYDLTSDTLEDLCCVPEYELENFLTEDTSKLNLQDNSAVEFEIFKVKNRKRTFLEYEKELIQLLELSGYECVEYIPYSSETGECKYAYVHPVWIENFRAEKERDIDECFVPEKYYYELD